MYIFFKEDSSGLIGETSGNQRKDQCFCKAAKSRMGNLCRANHSKGNEIVKYAEIELEYRSKDKKSCIKSNYICKGRPLMCQVI